MSRHQRLETRQVKPEKRRHALATATPSRERPLAAVGPVRADTIARLQQLSGNTAVQRYLAGKAAVRRQGAAEGPVTPLLPEIMDRLAHWFKNRPGKPGTLSKNPGLRNVLLTLYARLGPDLWRLIPPGAIRYVSEQGEMDFVPKSLNTVRDALIARGYTAAYFAKSGDNVWGLREPNLPAAGLHWRGLANGRVNVHIDLHPPSQTGLYHWFMDADHWFGGMRKRTHDPSSLQAGVESLGVYIPVLYEQRIHGELTGQLDALASQAKGNPDSEAEISDGRLFLRQAGAKLWNRAVVAQSDLEEAALHLASAACCVSGARHFMERERQAGKNASVLFGTSLEA